MNKKTYVEIASVVVSTVDLPIDHAWGDGPSLWYETMVFPSTPEGGISDYMELYCERYTTEEEALIGHENVVTRARAGEFVPFDNN